MGRTREAKAILVELERRIEHAEKNKQGIITYLQKLRRQYVDGEISHSQYIEAVDRKRKGRDLREWIEYYDEYIGKCERETNYQKKAIVKKQSAVVFVSLFFVFLFLMAGFYIQPKLTGFAVQEIPEENITVTENITGANITTTQLQAVLGQPVKWTKTISLDSIKNITIRLPTEATNISVNKISYSEETEGALPNEDSSPSQEEPSSSETTTNETEELPENITEETNESYSEETEGALPNEDSSPSQEEPSSSETTTNETGELSENITEETNESYSEEINRTEALPNEDSSPSQEEPSSSETNFSITGGVIGVEGKGFLSKLFRSLGRITGRAIDTGTEFQEIEINDTAIEYEIEYETPAPYAIEEDLENGKRVKIIGPETVHYENVLAFTNLPESLNIKNPSQVKIRWIENNTYINPTSVQDTDNNGIYDYIEWIAPSLSEQTFEIIVITKAEHLNSNREFISDIYDEVQALDDVWSEEIPDSDYVRVVFEIPLTSSRDITLYPRTTSGSPRIEVYEVNGIELIAEFTSLNDNEYNKVFLTNLQGTQDTFDLKILDGSVEFDHIIDPEVGISTAIYDGDDEYGAGPSVVFINDTYGYIFVQQNSIFAYSSWTYWKTTNGGTSWSGPTFIEDVAEQTPRSWSVWYDKWTPGNTGTLIHLVSNSYSNDMTQYNYLDTADDSTGSWVDADTSMGAHNAPDGGGSVAVSTDGNIFAGSQAGTIGEVLKYVSSWVDITPGWLHEDDDDHGQLLPISGGDILYIYEDSTANTLYYDIYDEGTDTWGGTALSITTITSATTNGVEDATWGAVLDGKNNSYLVLNNDVAAATGDLEAWFFNDTSRSWTQKTNILTDATAYDIAPAYDTVNDIVFAVYITGVDVYVKNSTDGGGTWGSAIQVNTATPPSGNWVTVKTNFMSDERIYAMYIEYSGGANADDLYGNVISDIVAPAGGDTTDPTVTLNSPIDFFNSSTSITFNGTAYDNINVDNVTLYGNWTGSWIANETNSTPINNTPTIFSKTISDGIYLWNYYTCDNSSNCAFASANRTFTVDTTAPTITLPIYTNATVKKSSESLFINASVSDSGTGASYCEINVETAAGGNTTVAVSSGWCNTSYSLSGASEGNQIINVYANDTLGNLGLNDSYVVYIDDTKPTWNNQGQSANLIGQGNEITLYTNWSDNAGLGYAWLETNETGTAKNYTDGTYGSPIDINLTGDETWSNFTWSNVSTYNAINWRIWANDTSDNINVTDYMTFIINATPVVSEPKSYNTSIQIPTDFDLNETVVIRTNISDLDGRADIKEFFITITDPLGGVKVANETVLKFYDDFTGGDGTDPPDWDEIAGWQIDSNRYRTSSSSGYNQVTLVKETALENQTDLTITAKTMIAFSNEDSERLIFRYTDNDNYVAAFISETYSAVGIEERIDGTRYFVDTSKVLSENVWYEMRVSVNGDSATLYLNGIKMVTKTLTTLGSGRVGLGGDTGWIYFDNFTVGSPNARQVGEITDGYEYEYNYSVPDNISLEGTWDIDVYSEDEFGNTGYNSSTFFVSGERPRVLTPQTYNEAGSETSSIILSNNVTIKVNVTDPQTESDLDTALINLTNPKSNLKITGGVMTNTSSITDGYIYEYNYTIPVEADSEGTWSVNIEVNDTSNNKDSNSVTFSVPSTFPLMETLNVYNDSYLFETPFEYELIHIRTNISDPDGRANLDTVLVTITNPFGTVKVNNETMTDIGDITNGNIYEYNYTIPSESDSTGTWGVDVYVNDSLNYKSSDTTYLLVEWWNTSWNYSKPIALGEIFNIDRNNEQLGFNLTIVDSKLASCDEVRVTDQYGAEVSSEIWWSQTSGGYTTCMVKFQSNITANDTTDYRVWYGNTGVSAPSYSYNWNKTMVLVNYTKWSYGGSGNTTYTKSIFVSDIDDDTTPEIISFGRTHLGTNTNYAELRIWNASFNQSNATDVTLNLEASKTWYTLNHTFGYSAYVYDIDGDETDEIITGGVAYNGTSNWAQLAVWNYTSGVINEETNITWITGNDNTEVYGIYVYDVDGDGTAEILTAGKSGGNDKCQFRIWNYTGGVLNLEYTDNWGLSSGKFCEDYAIAVGDLFGNNGSIIIGGSSQDGSNIANAHIRIYQWNNTGYELNQTKYWYQTDLTEIFGMAAEDIDLDGTVEIIASGNHFDLTRDISHVWVFNITNGILTSEANETRYISGHGSTTTVLSADIDNDDISEIISVGFQNDGTADRGYIAINEYNGSFLREKEIIWNETTSVRDGDFFDAAKVYDLNADGTKELISAGRYALTPPTSTFVRIYSVTGVGLTLGPEEENAPPLIDYNPTTTAGGNYSQTWIFINVSLTEENLDTIGYEFDNTNYTTWDGNDSTNYWVNKTSLSDGTYTFYAWANDSMSNFNQTSERTVILDTTLPQWFDNSTNSTLAGTYIEHRVRWTNTALSGYIFSFDNGTGTFTNDSYVTFSGTQNWSNVTKAVNSTVGSTIRWTVYANDTTDNLNVTSIFSYNTTGPPKINLDVIWPTGNVNVTKNGFFNVTVNVTCVDSDCGEINVSLDPFPAGGVVNTESSDKNLVETKTSEIIETNKEVIENNSINFIVPEKEIEEEILEEEAPVEIPETNVTEPELLENIATEINVTANATIITTQQQATLGQPVKWKKQITPENLGNLTLKLPEEAENILVNKISYSDELNQETLPNEDSSPSQGEFPPSEINFKITGGVIDVTERESIILRIFNFFRNSFKKIFGAITGRATATEEIRGKEVEIEIDDDTAEYEIEYETPAPYAIEEDIERGKRIRIIGPETVHYENVLAFTNLPESLNIRNPSRVRIHWIENDTYINPTSVQDTDNNRIYDYIEWIAPSLSEQTFEIIVITKAEHLDSNREFISDIYDEVQALDDVWSETISDEEYVRVTFEIPLDSSRDITIYPRVVSGTPRIEVYEFEGTRLIAEFTSLVEGKNKVYLTELGGSQDTFDLKVLDGDVEFDHIIDPWANTSFDRCMNITITNAGASTLTNFPAYINLSYDSDMQPDFIDIRFYNESCGNDGTLMDYEIESYTASTNAHIWLRLPSLPTTGTVISIYYKNNTGVGSGQNITGTWNSGYVMVQHLQESSGTHLDSTANNNDDTGGTVEDQDAIGRIDGADSFDGTANTKTFSTTGWSTSAGTVSLWANSDADLGGNCNIFSHRTAGTNDRVYIRCDAGGLTTSFGSTASGVIRPMDTGAWHQYVISWSGVNYFVYFDGVLNASGSDGAGLPSIDTSVSIASYKGGSGQNFDGRMDEVRVSNETRSGDWLNMSYQIVENQNTYVSFGGEESQAAGDTTDPTVTLNTPIDFFNSSSTSITFNGTASDDINVDNVTLYGNWTGSWIANETNSTPINNTPTIFSKTILDGTYVWNYYTCDNSSNCVFASANRTFTVDTTPPYFTTLVNQTQYVNESLNYDINAADDGVGFDSFAIDDTTNFSINPSTGVITNVTTLVAYTYNVNVSINDTLGNLNWSWWSLEALAISDTTPPQIEFVDPTRDDGNTTSDIFIEMNVTINNASDLDEVKWNWDGTNYTIFNDTLVLMYNFDNVSALGENDTLVVDVSGTGNNGTVIGGNVTTANGKYGRAMQFDGNGDYVDITTELVPDGYAGGWTGCAWFKAPEGSTRRFIFESSQSYAISLSFQSNDALEVYAQTSSGGSNCQAGNYDDDIWHYGCGTFNPTDNRTRAYADGDLICTGGAAPSNALAATDGFHVGTYRSANDRWFNGTIDEVRIWNRSLTAEEINQSYMSNLRKYDTDKWLLYINQSKTPDVGLDNGTYTYFSSAKDNSDNENLTETRTINIGIVYPTSAFGTNPVNNSYESSSSVTFDFRASHDTLDISNIKLYGNWTGSWVANYTNISYINNTWLNITVNGISDGTYVWGVFSNDSEGNSDFTDTNRTLTVDTTFPNIEFVAPTRDDDNITSDVFIEMNVSINESNLNEIKWNWNGTNFTIFNDSLVLMMNFDNVSALGENDTSVVDVSSYGNDGIVVGGNVTTTDSKYGRAMQFDGSGDYVDAGNDSSLDLNHFREDSISPDVGVHQGISRDGTYYYLPDTTSLHKRDLSYNVVETNSDPFSGISGANHMGDTDHYNGIIYAPVGYWNNCSDPGSQYIALYNASNLSYVDQFETTAQHDLVAGGVTVDPNAGDNGIIYIINFCDDSTIHQYDLVDYSYMGNITLSPTITNPQGIYKKNGYFYITGDSFDGIVKVDLNGNTVYSNKFNTECGGCGFITEGLDYSEDDIAILIEKEGIEQKLHFLTESEGFTVSAWVKPETQTGYRAVVSKFKSSDDQRSLWLGHNGMNATFLISPNGLAGGNGYLTTNYNLDNNWHYLVGRYDGSTVKIFVDGIERGTQNYNQGIFPIPEPLTIGAKNDPGDYFKGTIDEVRVYNRPLSAEEINQSYMSNLRKYDTDKWLLYVNQSKTADVGLDDGDYTYQTFAEDAAGNLNQTEERNITITTAPDSTDPTVTLNTPIDFFNSSSTSITFNGTAYDDINLDNVTLYGNWTGSWIANETNSTPINNTPTIFSKTISDGIYLWNYYTCDNSSNCAFASANRTFTVDTTPPYFTTLVNQTQYVNESLNYDINAADDGIGFDSFDIDDTTNFSINPSTGVITNITTLVEYYYAVNVSINDTLGNLNWSLWSLNVTAVPDTIYPQFSSYWDDNASLEDSGTGNFNVTVTSTNGTVLLEIDGTNVTATNLTTDVYNATYTFSSSGDYSYVWYSWGNGTSENLNNSLTKSYTVNSSAKSGLVSTTIGAKPFYTNESNPRNITLNQGESQLVVFWVNATGSVGTNHTFFAYANKTSDLSINNITSTWNVTITSENQAPTIPIVSNDTMTDLSSSGPNEGPVRTNVFINFTAYDADGFGNLDDSTALINFSRTGETTRENASCGWLADYNTYYTNYTCNVSMWWWDSTGIWNITAYIADNSADSGTNTSQTFSVGLTTGFVSSPSALNFDPIDPGATNQQATNDPILLNNTGNKDITAGDVQINSTNLRGEANPSYALYAGNFTVNTIDVCEGTIMEDHNFVGVASLSAGNYTINDGTAQEKLYFCLEQAGPELISQYYSTDSEGSWTIRILLVAVIPARRRKRKKIKRDKLVRALNLLAEELKEGYSREKEGVIKLLIKEIKKKYRLNNEEIRELVEIRREINIPSTIFTEKIGALETISKYMKDNLGMSYREIAEELNRNERTIWTAYNKAIEKQPEELEIVKTKIFLPLSMFKDRKLTILESIIVYLKEKGMKYSEIAELLDRNQRNIWTIYNRTKKK